MGAASEPYAASCFFRCIGLVERAEQAAGSGAFDPDEAAEFVVGALDLIRCAAPSPSLMHGRLVLRGWGQAWSGCSEGGVAGREQTGRRTGMCQHPHGARPLALRSCLLAPGARALGPLPSVP